MAALVCGRDTLVGSALVTRLHEAGWRTVAIDAPDAPAHPAADIAMQGEIWHEAFWEEVRDRLAASGTDPQVFVHAVSGFQNFDGRSDLTSEDTLRRTLVSAELGCQYLMPLLPRDRGAIVILASVLAGWDTRPDVFGATQAGLLALVRSQALLAGPHGVRVNAIAMGLVGESDSGEVIPAGMLERIPLGRYANPADIGDAVMFLLSPDARHVTGSSLVVDGGQSLQSWSNAPREGFYPPPSPPSDTRPRVVLVTGAAGGLGSAIARRFATAGDRLALLDRDAAAVRNLAAAVAQQGGEALPVEADVADESSLAAAMQRAEEHFGRIDAIVNNAGIGGLDLAVDDTPAERWDEMLAINLRGVFLGCKHGVPALRRAGGGVIVNMGSSTGRHDTITGGAAYMASKAAVEALTKSLALQVARYGIRANTLCPGIIETPLSFRQQADRDQERFFAEFAARIPLGRVGQPEDVAAAAAFLASDQARQITGASLLIDGGQTLRRWISAPDLGRFAPA